MASAVGPLEGASARNFQHGTPEGRDERVDTYRPSLQCPSECTGCDPRASDSETGIHSVPPLQGGSLVVASFCYFLLPLAAALLGAVLAGEGALRQLVGAGGGLLVAAVLAAWIAGSLKRHWPETP
jgi:hypothetical protein